MSLILRSILAAFTGRSDHTGAADSRHRVRRHTRGKPRGGKTSVRKYCRRNRG
jgi:hypothetical protein